MEKTILKIFRIDEKYADIALPKYETEGSSGMDIRAAIEDTLELLPGKFSLIPTNLKFEIPFGYEIQVRPRSGLAAKYGIGVLNSPGTIDSDYRGEVKIILFNFSDKPFIIKRGDRIAQIVLAKVIQAKPVLSSSLSKTERGEGGFGHTGKE